MLKQPDIQKIRSLFAEGYNLRQITEITGFSRNTVRRYIRSEEGVFGFYGGKELINHPSPNS